MLLHSSLAWWAEEQGHSERRTSWSCWKEGVFCGKKSPDKQKSWNCHPYVSFLPFSLKRERLGERGVSFCLVFGKRNAWKEVPAILVLWHFAHPAPAHFSWLDWQVCEPDAFPGEWINHRDELSVSFYLIFSLFASWAILSKSLCVSVPLVLAQQDFLLNSAGQTTHKFVYTSLLQITQAGVSDPKGLWTVEVSSRSIFNSVFFFFL